MTIELLPPDGLVVAARQVPWRAATFSVDIETDYGTGRTEALDQTMRFADLMSRLDVPWTAFVEGQLFRTRPALCRELAARGVDVQLHVYDHATPGDTPASLADGVAAYADCLGRLPAGYRAHTYRLTRPLYEALRALGFRWDSSLMRAFAQGGNRHPAFARGDYLVFDDGFVEFPIANWRGTSVPLNHTHLLLLRRPGELMLRGIAGPGRLVAYNCHMTDLVRSDSLRHAVRTRTVRMLYRYMWLARGPDTFGVLARFIDYLGRRGYACRTSDDLYHALEADASGRAPLIAPASARSRPGAPAPR